MVGIGIVGIGFMGMIHYLASRRVPGAQVVALCSRDPKKLAGDWTSIQGNFGPRGTQMDLSGLALYDDYADMLADPQIHLVRPLRAERLARSPGRSGIGRGEARSGRKADRFDDRGG